MLLVHRLADKIVDRLWPNAPPHDRQKELFTVYFVLILVLLTVVYAVPAAYLSSPTPVDETAQDLVVLPTDFPPDSDWLE